MKTKEAKFYSYQIAKRKEYTTKAIALLNGLLAGELEGHPDIIKARDVLVGYRKALDED